MKYLYIDNLRGFSKVQLPIKDVNFMVGENSTGKTSFLSVIGLITNENFWFNSEQSIKEYNFNNFKENVSLESKNKSYFKIGYLKLDKDPSAFMLTFRNKNGLTNIYKYDLYQSNQEINIIITDKKVRYKFHAKNDKNNTNIEDVFNYWKRVKVNTSGYKELKPISLKRPQPLMIAPVLIKQKEDPKNPESNTISVPSIMSELADIAPIRSEPRKTYDDFNLSYDSGGSHTPYLIKSFLDSINKKDDFQSYIRSFGKKSGLFEDLNINLFGGRVNPASPFSLDILFNGKSMNISKVGYGVSQILPLIVEIFSRTRFSCFTIQQPEIHLHPKAQSALGGLIFEFANLKDHRFFIETHSDYIIDRFRLHSNKLNHNCDSQVLFFEKSNKGNKVTPIEICKNGTYSVNQPKSFRDFFIKEEMSLLEIR